MDFQPFRDSLLEAGMTSRRLGAVIGKRNPATSRERLQNPLTFRLWEVLALACALGKAPIDLFPWLAQVPTREDMDGCATEAHALPPAEGAASQAVKIIIQDLRNGKVTHAVTSQDALRMFRDQLTLTPAVPNGHEHRA